MTDSAFTGERLHDQDALFAIDLIRHRAAYRHAAEHVAGRRTVEFGSGSGYGAAELAAAGIDLVCLDRIAPDRTHRDSGACFVRADLRRAPIAAGRFGAALSFQVIEHLEDPEPYLSAITRSLRDDGLAIVTTPNRLTSDGENPFHVHEYTADELGTRLGAHFDEVEMLGVGARGEVARYYEERLARIRRIVRLDPLRLRQRIPRGLVEWLFARLAVFVRRGIAGSEGLPEASFDDFPIGPADEACLDLLAICRRPRRGA